MKQTFVLFISIFISVIGFAQKPDSTHSDSKKLPPGAFPRYPHTYELKQETGIMQILYVLVFGTDEQKENLKVFQIKAVQAIILPQIQKQEQDFYIQDSLAYYNPKQKK